MKLSDTLKKVEEALSPEEYRIYKSRIQELTVTPHNLTVEELYEDPSNYQYLVLTVSRRSLDSYAVTDRFSVYSKEQDEYGKHFIHESIPSSRTEEFIKNTRFSLEEAVMIAEIEVENMTVMGKNVDWMKKHAQ